MPMLLACVEYVKDERGRHPCGALSPQSRCPTHRREYERKRDEREPWRLLYDDPRWTVVSRKVRARDGYRCTYITKGVRCTVEGPLSVHHEKKLRHIWRDCGSPQRGTSGWEHFVRLALDMRQLRTLCERCHKFVDNTNPQEKWVGVPPVEATAQDRRQKRSHRRMTAKQDARRRKRAQN